MELLFLIDQRRHRPFPEFIGLKICRKPLKIIKKRFALFLFEPPERQCIHAIEGILQRFYIALSLFRNGQPVAPQVVWICDPLHHSVPLQPLDRPGHCRRRDLQVVSDLLLGAGFMLHDKLQKGHLPETGLISCRRPLDIDPVQQMELI